MRRHRAMVVAVILLSGSLAASGRVPHSHADTPGMTLGFAAPVSYSEIAGGTSWGVAVADLNGDGKPDLVVTDKDDGAVSLLLGKGDGTFQPEQDFSADGGAEAVEVADFNGDGKPDLAVVNFGDSSVSVMLGNGDGTVQPRQDVTANSPVLYMATADFNGDGMADLAIATPADMGVEVWLSTGGGRLQFLQIVSTSTLARGVVAADFNGDGRPDLAVGNSSENSVSVLLGKGDGTFQPKQDFGTGSRTFAVFAADINGDGKLDLVTADHNSNSYGASVLLGNGDGSFQPHQDFSTPGTVVGMAVADFNGDGKPDLVIFTYPDADGTTNGALSVLLGNGDGTLQPHQDFGAGTESFGVAAADLNGDGKPDMVVTDINTSSVHVWLNTSPFAAALALPAPAQQLAPGQVVSFTLTAQTSAGGTASGYRGTVHFTSTDPQTLLPPDYTFTAADAGVHQFPVAPNTVGSQTLTATDTAWRTVTGLVMLTVKPAVAAINPTKGSLNGGTTVTLTGSGFAPGSSGTSISFGAHPATNVHCSTTSCTAQSPAGSGVVDVQVTVNGQTSPTSSAGRFVYLPVPSITSISPASGPVAGGTLVTIRGSGFDVTPSGTTISFGDVQAAIARKPAADAQPTMAGASTQSGCVSDTVCYAVSPPGAVGAVPVGVSTAGGASPASPAGVFVYGRLGLLDVQPHQGPPTTPLTLTGVGFAPGMQVSFTFHHPGQPAPVEAADAGGAAPLVSAAGNCTTTRCTVPASSVRCAADGSCTATVSVPLTKPPLALDMVADVQVTVGSGRNAVSSPVNHPADQFQYELPLLKALDFASGPPAATLTLSGSGFADKTHTTVVFTFHNGASSKATVLSCAADGSSCAVQVPNPPPGVASAQVQVVVGGMPSDATFTYTYDVPALNTAQFTADGQHKLTRLTLTGTGFGSKTDVMVSWGQGASKKQVKATGVGCKDASGVESGTICLVKLAQPAPPAISVTITVLVGGWTSQPFVLPSSTAGTAAGVSASPATVDSP